jgi:hypothetical protein
VDPVSPCPKMAPSPRLRAETDVSFQVTETLLCSLVFRITDDGYNLEIHSFQDEYIFVDHNIISCRVN